MAFIKRVLDHLLNQVLVEGLANSRWFQRFAVWSHTTMKDITEKGKGAGASLNEANFTQWTSVAKEASSKWQKEFAEELRKLQQQGGGGGKPPGDSGIKKG